MTPADGKESEEKGVFLKVKGVWFIKMLTLWKVDTTERVSSIFIEHHVSHKVQDGIPYAKHCQSLAKTYAINQFNIWIPPFHRKKLIKVLLSFFYQN